jgi:hypothetical protein
MIASSNWRPLKSDISHHLLIISQLISDACLNLCNSAAQHTKTRKEKSFSKDVPLLHQLLFVLCHEEDVDSIVIQGKRWVFLPRLNLGKRLNCSGKDVLKSLDILHQEGYIESLNPSSEDVEEPPFFRVNRKKYHNLFGSPLKINLSHQQL